jgi:ATP-dependent DNA helicase DinG
MFVLLSAATPSRLLVGFPGDVRVSRVPLDEAIRRVRLRLASGAGAVHDDVVAQIDEVE